MTTRVSPPPDAALIEPTLEPLIAALEVAASEQPDVLPWVLDVVAQSAARPILLDLAEEWDIQPQELFHVALQAARHLDEVEARRGAVPSSLTGSDLAPLFGFAVVRSRRIQEPRRQRRLEILALRLADVLGTARKRRHIQGFIGVGDREKPAVDREWILAFLRD